MDRIKRVFVANQGTIGRRVLIGLGTGVGIAIAALAYGAVKQNPDVEVTETVEYDTTPDI
jgi:hypothetical protein